MADDDEISRMAREGRRGPAPRPSVRNPIFLGRVTTTAPAVGKFMKVQPVALSGTESEGSAGVRTDQGTTAKLVYLMGPGVPATGDEVVSVFEDWRWVTGRRVTSPPPPPPPPTVNIAGCGCQGTPTTLHVVPVQVGSGCLGQGWGICDGPTSTFEPFDLTWTTVPAALGTAPGANGYPNAGSLCYCAGPFPYSCGSTSGDQYWLFYCFGSHYAIANWNVPTGGSPALFIISAAMTIGSNGNTCSPFSFNNHSGGATCWLTIVE